jgi:hypothetical protein
MADRVWFATTNDTRTMPSGWKNWKGEDGTQEEYRQLNNSGFNGFPFGVIELPKSVSTDQARDAPYDFCGIGSAYNVGPMTLAQAVEFYWRVKYFYFTNQSAGQFDISNPIKNGESTTEKGLCTGLSPYISYFETSEDEDASVGAYVSREASLVQDAANHNNFYMELWFHLYSGSGFVNEAPIPGLWPQEAVTQSFPAHPYQLDDPTFIETQLTINVTFGTHSIPVVGYKLRYDFFGDPGVDVSEIKAIEYWPYANSAGQPVWDTTTGAQLVDPAS